MTFPNRQIAFTIIAFALAVTAIPSFANAQGFELRTTHKEVPGTREIEAGRPTDAIRLSNIKLPHARGLQKVAVLTNLCIGHIMVNKFEQAEQYCEEAASRPNERAVTHNNRGVLKALQGNFAAARADFAIAANVSCLFGCSESDTESRKLPNNVARRNLQKTEARMVEVASIPTSEQLAAQENR